MQKLINRWYSRLTRTGKILLAAAGVALVWLIVQLVNAIFGLFPSLSDLGLGWLAFILNTICIMLVTFVAVQFGATLYMLREESKQVREMMTKGRRGGSRLEQVAGRRTQSSLTRKGARSMSIHLAGHLTVDNINQKYPPKWYKRPILIPDWKEISEPGLYALESDPKNKIEVIDASELGGGFYLGTWEGRWVKWRRKILCHKKTGDPLSFSTMRNVKKQISKLQ